MLQTKTKAKAFVRTKNRDRKIQISSKVQEIRIKSEISIQERFERGALLISVIRVSRGGRSE